MLSLPGAVCQAQNYGLNLPEVTPPSPTAMELAKHVTYPVNLSNGLAKISIPLYEIIDGEIRIPITLDYHASGLKPGMRSADWIGDGWSLSVGPTLSRIINGGADEQFYSYLLASEQHPTWEQLNAVNEGAVDVLLDEFYYSLPENSGKLYFKRLSQYELCPVTIPQDNIKVSLPEANKYGERIDIRDASGMLYRFGGEGRTYKDYVDNHYGISVIEMPSSWKINTIESPTGRRIKFEYSSPQEEIFTYRFADAVVMLDEFSAHVGVPLADVAVCASQGISEAHYFKYDLLSQSLQETTSFELSLPEGYVFPMPQRVLISQKNAYVRKISFCGGYIIFTKSEKRGEGLKEITVYDETSNIVRKIMFEQHYNSDFLRLILNGVRISGIGHDDEKYTFTYRPFETDRNTRSIDEWGYYNGADNHTLVPTISTTATLTSPFMTVDVSMPGADRQPNEQAMQQGILTGITYPTGGRSEFYYEAHRYQNDSGKVMLAGGLRIKQIRDVESSGSIIYRNFSYSTSSDTINGLGIRNVIPIDSKIPGDENGKYYRETTLHHITIPFVLPVCDVSFKERVWTDNSMVNLFSESGSSVSYPYVTETVSSDEAGNHKIGETVSCFNVGTSRPMKFGKSQFFIGSEDEWRRGEKVYEKTFASYGDSSAIVRRKDYSHSILPATGQSDKLITEYVYCTELPYGIDTYVIQEQYKKFSYVRHEINNGIKVLLGEHVTTYGENGNVGISTHYQHDSVGIVKEIMQSGSSPQGSKKVRFLHPNDMVTSGRDPDGIYSKMHEYNFIGIPVETKEYRGDSLVSTITMTYTNPEENHFYPRQVKSVIGDNSGDARTIEFLQYDSWGNIMEREDVAGQREVYLWGYGGKYPVAKIIGSDWSSVRSVADTAILNNGSEDEILSQLNALRSSLSDESEVLIWTWTYRPLVGVTSETDPSGRSVYYEYDGLGRLKRSYIKDGGVERTLKTWQYHYKR